MASEIVGSACGRIQEPRKRLFPEEGGGGGGGGEEVTSGNTPIKERLRSYKCFACNQDGHFARDCPSTRRSPAALGEAERRVYPERQCPCGRGPCVVLMSRTAKNPGRHFYSCPSMVGPKLDAGRAATTDDKPETMLIDVSRDLETPLLSPKRARESSEVGLSSPLKRLGLRDRSGGASSPEKCYRCGEGGHRMKECTWSFRPTCFKCGRCGHWTDNCTA
ncbi:hypothetical protein B296_00054520 [Ensete ventricosum]|uniref:CCHC-type domain-containing protein n=1 Tax=Ensete ventricosum TaxID=4639 RepID=A0A426Y3P6_ENSVE|nr:hypothetical protein B296_00054520 [Ensete ventricosum]